MDLNLETLKTEILDYLGASDFAVFRSHTGALDEMPIIFWDSERFPDYRMFLDVARKADQKLILFASRELDEEEVEEALEELEDSGLTREEKREFEARIREGRKHVGGTCALEIAFDYQSRLYVYSLEPDWYEEFSAACEELSGIYGLSQTDGDEHDGLGGFYSNN